MADPATDRPSAHDALVEELLRDARRVRRLWPVWARLAAWLALQAGVVAAVAAAGLRPDLGERLHDPVFVVGLLVLALTGSSLAMLALRTAIPGREPGRRGIAAEIGRAHV